MNFGIEQNILQNAVAEPWNPLFRGQERFRAHLQALFGKQRRKKGAIELVRKRGNALFRRFVIYIVFYFLRFAAQNAAVHGNRANQRRAVLKFQPKLVFKGQVFALFEIAKIDAVPKIQDNVRGFNIQPAAESRRIAEGFPGKPAAVLRGIPGIPGEFVRRTVGYGLFNCLALHRFVQLFC